MIHYLYKTNKETGFIEVGHYDAAGDWVKKNTHQDQVPASRECEMLNRDEMIWQRRA